LATSRAIFLGLLDHAGDEVDVICGNRFARERIGTLDFLGAMRAAVHFET